jgi:hypothetical protein
MLLNYSLFMLVFLSCCVLISFWLVILTGIMAHKRNRSVILWVLISIFFTPLFAPIYLLALGPAPVVVQIPYEESKLYYWIQCFRRKFA